MDGSSFDRLSRQFAARATRRRALGAVAGALIAGAAGAGAADTARVCTRPGRACTRDGQCCSGRCRRPAGSRSRQRLVCDCPTGETLCGMTCQDLQTTASNCGACGHACDAGADACTDGACTCGDGPACTGGVSCIDGVCGVTTCVAPDYQNGIYCAVSMSGVVESVTAGTVYPSTSPNDVACTGDAQCTAYANVQCGAPSVWCVCIRGYDEGNDFMTLSDGYESASPGLIPAGSGGCMIVTLA
jgi:hypothetical protein